MRKIMFNDKYDLTNMVVFGRKTMTRRFANEANPLKPHYSVGEVLAVAQPYKNIPLVVLTKGIKDPLLRNAQLQIIRESAGYDNKMFVLSDLMQYHIRITGAKLEALQDITNYDAAKEGVYTIDIPTGTAWTYKGSKACFQTASEAFAAFIDKVCGKGTWQRNPMVWAYDFELVK